MFLLFVASGNSVVCDVGWKDHICIPVYHLSLKNVNNSEKGNQLKPQQMNAFWELVYLFFFFFPLKCKSTRPPPNNEEGTFYDLWF